MRYAITALAALAALGITGTAVAEGMHGMMGEGEMTKEAYLKHAEARFARMDVNNDGVIDATDRAAMRKRMHDCMGMMDGKGDAAAGGSGEDHQGHHP